MINKKTLKDMGLSDYKATIIVRIMAKKVPSFTKKEIIKYYKEDKHIEALYFLDTFKATDALRVSAQMMLSPNRRVKRELWKEIYEISERLINVNSIK